MVNMLHLIGEVTLHRAWLLLGWETVGRLDNHVI